MSKEQRSKYDLNRAEVGRKTEENRKRKKNLSFYGRHICNIIEKEKTHTLHHITFCQKNKPDEIHRIHRSISQTDRPKEKERRGLQPLIVCVNKRKKINNACIYNEIDPMVGYSNQKDG